MDWITKVKQVIIEPRGTDLGSEKYPITSIDGDRECIANGIRNCRYYIGLPGRHGVECGAHGKELKVHFEITVLQTNVEKADIARFKENYARVGEVFYANEPYMTIYASHTLEDGTWGMKIPFKPMLKGWPASGWAYCWRTDKPSIGKIADFLHKMGYDWDELVVMPSLPTMRYGGLNNDIR